MGRSGRRWILACGLVVAAAIVAVVLSPYVAMVGLRQAGVNREQAELLRRVDFRSLRDELYRSTHERMLRDIRSDDEFGHNPLAGFSLLALPAVVQRTVDGVGTPEGLATLIQTGEPPRTPIEARFPPPASERPAVRWSGRYLDWRRFEIALRRRDAPAQRATRIGLERQGPVAWKVVRIMPPA